MKFKIEDGELKMNIKLEDFAFLFNESDNNYEEFKVKKDNLEEFVQEVVEYLLEPKNGYSNCINWGIPFENAFEELIENGSDVIDFNY